METSCVGSTEVADGAVDTVTSREEDWRDVVLVGRTDVVGGDTVWAGGSREKGGREGGRERREREREGERERGREGGREGRREK